MRRITRRTLLSTGATAAAMATTSCSENRPASATFVLVHGAWAGGWAWKRVAPLLRAQGHDVFTPTLTGLGERVHLASPGVNLDTHIQDIVNLLVYEDLEDAVLVGWSYGGMVVTGVLDRVPDRLAHVGLSRWRRPRRDGESDFDISGPEFREEMERSAQSSGGGMEGIHRRCRSHRGVLQAPGFLT